jgi:hypothetical protein
VIKAFWSLADRRFPAMHPDCLLDAMRPAVMQQVNAAPLDPGRQPQAPQRRSTPFGRLRSTFRIMIVQAGPHIVYQ